MSRCLSHSTAAVLMFDAHKLELNVLSEMNNPENEIM